MNILWLIGAILLLAVLQTFLFCFFGFKRVKYHRAFDRRCVYEGESVVMREVISNRKILPVPWLRVEARMDSNLRFGSMENLEVTGDLHHASLFSLGGYSQIRRSHYVQCLERGYYPLASVSLTTGDLFGLWSVSKSEQVDSSLIVYPAPLDPSEMEIPSRKWQGDVVLHRWIQPDPYLVNGIRAYTYGDSPRDVHWAATARTGELQVKTHDYTASPKLLCLFNVQRDETQWGVQTKEAQKPMEYGLRQLSTLAHEAVSMGLEVGLYTNGYLTGYDEKDQDAYVMLPEAGQMGLDRLLERLARLDLSHSRISFHSYMDWIISHEQPTGMDIVLFSAYDSDRLRERMRTLEQMGNSVTLWPMTREGGSHAA